MLTPQPLAQEKQVLWAKRDNDAHAQQEALSEGINRACKR
jgi:hypothetical protein